MYNSGRGRFMQPDPMGLRAANMGLPGTLNRYNYVRNDPVNFVDPGGTCIVYWHQASESWGYWDTILCYDNPHFWIEQPSPTPNNDGGGGEPFVPPTESELLVKRLQNLPQACVDAFGGKDKINGWIKSIQDGDVRFYSSTSTEAIRKSPSGETVNGYWKRKNLDAVGHNVWYNDWGGGNFDYRTYGTIILGPGYYDPTDPDLGAFNIYFNNGENVARAQQNMLLHEFLHWETNAGHSVIFDKLNLGTRGYDSTNPARELDKFLANDCKNKN